MDEELMALLADMTDAELADMYDLCEQMIAEGSAP